MFLSTFLEVERKVKIYVLLCYQGSLLVKQNVAMIRIVRFA